MIETLKRDHARLRQILETFEHALKRDDGWPNERFEALLGQKVLEDIAHLTGSERG